MTSLYSASVESSSSISPLQVILPSHDRVGVVLPERLCPVRFQTACPSNGDRCVGITGGPELSQSYVISRVGVSQSVASVLQMLTNFVEVSSIPTVDATSINSSAGSGVDPDWIRALLSSIHFWIAAVNSTSTVSDDWSPSKLVIDIEGTLPPSSQ